MISGPASVPATTGEFALGVEHSAGGRIWRMRPAGERAIRQLQQESGLDEVSARLLAARGVGPADVALFLKPSLRATFPDPSSFADLDRAADIIVAALKDGRPCAVFADYDVDGGSAAAILIRYFRALGRKLELYVPDRIQEGYGPSPAAFAKLKARGIALVITVDCGAAAFEALEAAENMGLPVIVLDHHLMHGEIPKTAALVNPNRPDCRSGMGSLTAAGVAFVMCAGLNRLGRKTGLFADRPEPDILQWLDLAAMGTLCDVAPLRGFNRAIVSQGLKVLARTQNPGLRRLSELANLSAPDKTWHATFALGPRLNAGGRIGAADLAARALSEDDPAEIGPLAIRLDQLNIERRAIEADILEAALQAGEAQLARHPDSAAIVVGAEGWHPGVVGIIAARLKEKFFRPAIAIGWGGAFGEHGKGSGRSIEGVNLGRAISQAARDGVLIAGGGHAMAAGLTIEPGRIDAFRAILSAALTDEYRVAPNARTEMVDIVLRAEAADERLARFLQSLEPFGPANPEPVIAMSNVRPVFSKRMGADGAHLRVTLEGESGGRVDAVAFRVAGNPVGEALEMRGRPLHVIGRLSLDRWNGRERVKYELIDAALA